jgi:hypothetical protein
MAIHRVEFAIENKLPRTQTAPNTDPHIGFTGQVR